MPNDVPGSPAAGVKEPGGGAQDMGEQCRQIAGAAMNDAKFRLRNGAGGRAIPNPPDSAGAHRIAHSARN